MKYFSGEDWGADCPSNWKEICEYLNEYADKLIKDGDDVDEVTAQMWQDYCCERYPYNLIPEERFDDEEDVDKDWDDEQYRKWSVFLGAIK